MLLGALAVPVAKYFDSTLDSQEWSQGHSERATLPKAFPTPSDPLAPSQSPSSSTRQLNKEMVIPNVCCKEP